VCFPNTCPRTEKDGEADINTHLKPQKYPQSDLFVCDITEVILKDDMASMEHPFYSLFKKPDREPRRYEYKAGRINHSLRVYP
jgi:hypothetical protein